MPDTITYTCHSCGATVSTTDQICAYCGNPVNITAYSSLAALKPPQIAKYISLYEAEGTEKHESAKALAYCFLKVRLYKKAQPMFDKALEENYADSELYFYAAVCRLQGKKAFLTPRGEINEAISHLDAANMIEAKAIYHYLLAYIKCDYFARKGYKTSPNYQDELASAMEMGLTAADQDHLFELLGVARPDVL